MSYRNMRMADAHLSLDSLLEGVDAEKAPVLSDGGEGARRIYRAADAENEEEHELQLDNQRFVLLLLAEVLLELAGLERLVPVLEQIVKNGANRQESICNLAMIWHLKRPIARVKYYRGAAALLKLFSPNKNAVKMHF